MSIVINKNGLELNFDAAVPHMDEELLEILYEELSQCTEQEFFTAYEHAHARKYGEEWFLSSANPCW